MLRAAMEAVTRLRASTASQQEQDVADSEAAFMAMRRQTVRLEGACRSALTDVGSSSELGHTRHSPHELAAEMLLVLAGGMVGGV